MAEQQSPKTSKPTHTPGTGKGEEYGKGQEPGRRSEESTGKAKRPAAKSTGRDSSSVSPQNPVDPNSPHMPTP
jgi:hypothetical protein